MAEKTRDTYFDNLKTILIFLVVLGHFTSLNKSIPLIGAINNVIYSFHMPIFIFISGFFSKNITSRSASVIENILYPYLVFQVLNYFFTKLTGLGYGLLNIFIPTYQNWYLLGLLFWRVSIPFYSFFNKIYSLYFTIILSLTIGFFDDFNSFALYRIIYFFPIFILGYYCSNLKAILRTLSKYKYYFICISALGLFAIFFLSFFSSKFNDMIFYAYTPYKNYNHSIINFSFRIIGFFSSLIISFGLLFLIPENKFKVINFGENTLSIFLLHMFIVFPINKYLLNIPSYLILLTSIISSILICILFSSKLLIKILAPLTNMKQLQLLIKNYR